MIPPVNEIAENQREKKKHTKNFCTHYQTHKRNRQKVNVDIRRWFKEERASKAEIMAIVCNVMKKTCSKPITAFVFQPANSAQRKRQSKMISIVWYIWGGRVCELLNETNKWNETHQNRKTKFSRLWWGKGRQFQQQPAVIKVKKSDLGD